MHILMVSSEPFCGDRNHLNGIFERDQAAALLGFGCDVGAVDIELGRFFLAQEIRRFLRDGGAFRLALSLRPVIDDFVRSFVPVISRFSCDEGLTVEVAKVRSMRAVPGSMLFDLLAWSLSLKVAVNKYCGVFGVPDVIHAHNALPAGFSSVLVGREIGVPVVVTEHSSLYAGGVASFFDVFFSRFVYKMASRSIFVSSYLRSEVSRVVGAECDGVVVPNVIPSSVVRVRNELGVVSRRRGVVLSAGRMDSNKNHILLVRALSLIPSGLCPALRLIGDGPERKKIEREVERLGVSDRVFFLGYLRRDEVYREMMSADVFCLPSISETFGVVLIEAMALGCPVVSTPCGGPEEIVSERSGFVANSNSACELADKICRALRMEWDRSAVSSYAEEMFSGRAFFEKISGVYRGVME